MKIKSPVKLFLSILLCQSAGILGSFFTAPSISGWYATLEKPFFNPPGWIFGPVWILLYTLMGISLYLVWVNKRHILGRKKALYIFFAQLALNAVWSILFFGVQNMAVALVDIILLLTLIIMTTKSFLKIDKRAAYLLYPYIAWVSFATLLNFSLLLLNL